MSQHPVIEYPGIDTDTKLGNFIRAWRQHHTLDGIFGFQRASQFDPVENLVICDRFGTKVVGQRILSGRDVQYEYHISQGALQKYPTPATLAKIHETAEMPEPVKD